jgi:hypothetical protein
VINRPICTTNDQLRCCFTLGSYCWGCKWVVHSPLGLPISITLPSSHHFASIAAPPAIASLRLRAQRRHRPALSPYSSPPSTVALLVATQHRRPALLWPTPARCFGTGSGGNGSGSGAGGGRGRTDPGPAGRRRTKPAAVTGI